MKLKTKLSISSWNVEGLFYRNNNERVCKLNDSEFTSQIKSDIVCLLETKAEKGDNVTLESYSLLKHFIRQGIVRVSMEVLHCTQGYQLRKVFL